MTTLEKVYEAVVQVAKQIEDTWINCEHGEDEECEHRIAMNEADKTVEAAELALETGLRTWHLYEEGFCYTTVEATSLKEAMKVARENVDAASYEVTTTIWVSVHVECKSTDEEDTDTVALNPPEPSCSESEHNWQSPHAIVGGLRENPGVWGKGGGVVIHEVCLHCGCEKQTDTWAQDRHNGRQGLRSVSYEAKKYANEVASN